MSFRTRFAPSPTGPLHLGHAYSAMLAHDMAKDANGTFLLRIEDIDRSRCRDEWEALIYEDLRWLGIYWEEPVVRQSERMEAYAAALSSLRARGVLYACRCNRRDVMEAASAPQGAPVFGPDGVVYPGTCRALGLPFDGEETVLRLDMGRALDVLGGEELAFVELGSGSDGQRGRINVSPDVLLDRVGDIVLARRDMGTSYHLSVVVDDSAQGVTHVVRGQDLFEATWIHVVLAHLLGAQIPAYHHHRLINDDQGKRLAKRHDARAIRKYRDDGVSVGAIRQMLGFAG